VATEERMNAGVRFTNPTGLAAFGML